MADYHFYVQIILRGYHHAYKSIVVTLGEILTCEAEPDNEFESFLWTKNRRRKYCEASSCRNSSKNAHFLNRWWRSRSRDDGCRFNKGAGKGLEIPIDVKCIGSFSYLREVSLLPLEFGGTHGFWKSKGGTEEFLVP